eukprot:GHUV01038766.1.p1 GENE.GHUV01038766.1~~GHUV01038766.1.p1  ORF type:complete len:113 (-),score=21.32 GHUV01038766.1:591-929(-)
MPTLAHLPRLANSLARLFFSILRAVLFVQRLQAVVANYSKLLIASRNLDFFTSFYRFLIQLLPAAVVAPLFFAGMLWDWGWGLRLCLPCVDLSTFTVRGSCVLHYHIPAAPM